MRSFTRTFITVPRGDGIVIANETFHVTNASPEQQEVSNLAALNLPEDK